jgi:hypothetical protein
MDGWCRHARLHMLTVMKNGEAVWNTYCAPLTESSKVPSVSRSASNSSSLPGIVNETQYHSQMSLYSHWPMSIRSRSACILHA